MPFTCCLRVGLSLFSPGWSYGWSEIPHWSCSCSLFSWAHWCYTGGGLPWDRVRSFFIEEAVIILLTSREETSQFTVDEFIEDFKGFKEEVLQLESQVYHDMAYIAVVYEAAILASHPNTANMESGGSHQWDSSCWRDSTGDFRTFVGRIFRLIPCFFGRHQIFSQS